MIIDSHTHIFPPEIRTRRQDYFDGEPAFELLYASPKARMAGADDIVAMMDDQGVDRSVVFGFPWQDPDTYRRHNDYIIAAVKRYPHRLTGLCCLDVMHPGAVDEVRRCLDAGLAGVGELAFYRSGIDAVCRDRLAPVMALCAERQCPVMIHTNEPVGHQYPGKTPNTLTQIYALAQQFADNDIILAHWGGGIFFYEMLKKEVSDTLARVYYDTAASPFLYQPAIYAQALALAGPGKVLLGTDFPLLKPVRYFKEMHIAGLDDAQIEAVCGANATRLFRIDADR